MKLLSTRTRAELWRLQNAVRQAAKERERLLRILTTSRAAMTAAAQKDAAMEFVCADQEYRYTVASLEAFVQTHDARVDRAKEEADSHMSPPAVD